MWTYFCSALTAKVLPPQFRCRFILYIFTQFRAVLHEGLALQRDEASLFASKKSKPSNSHLVKFKRFLHVSECNLASTWKIAEQYIQWHWRSVPMVIDNNYTLSVYCCVDIIISLNGYCTCTDADDAELLWHHFITKYYKWATTRQNQHNDVRKAKSQISLCIHTVWSESSLCAQWVANDPSFLHADSEDSDLTG